MHVRDTIFKFGRTLNASRNKNLFFVCVFSSVQKQSTANMFCSPEHRNQTDPCWRVNTLPLILATQWNSIFYNVKS